MRTLIIIISFVIILFGGSVSSYRFVETRTQTMGVLLESVEDSITIQKWEEAQKELTIVQQKWRNDNTWWSIFLDHYQIDNIDINMRRLEKFIGIQDFSQSIGEITTLKLHFEHISDTELLTINNIF